MIKNRIKAQAEAAGMEFFEIDPQNPQLPPDDGKQRMVFVSDLDSLPQGVLDEILMSGSIEESDPWIDHEYCTTCRECITCNLRPCRDGGPHTSATDVPSVQSSRPAAEPHSR